MSVRLILKRLADHTLVGIRYSQSWSWTPARPLESWHSSPTFITGQLASIVQYSEDLLVI